MVGVLVKDLFLRLPEPMFGGSTEPSSAQEYGLLYFFLNFCSIPVAATVGLMVTRIGPKRSASKKSCFT